MKLKDFDYDLPKNLIAQEPIKPRDHSRLLVLNKKTGKMEHRHFYDIIKYLKKGDILVLNNTKVMPARLIGRKVDTGGKVEVFLLKKQSFFAFGLNSLKSPSPPLLKGAKEIWQCLVGGKKRKENLIVEFDRGLKAEVVKNNLDGTWQVKFNKSGGAFMKIVKKIGQVPLPPYIKRQKNKKAKKQESKDYQTVYADGTKLGSVAAPTAGLHFTPALLKKLKNQGVRIEYVTLRVGLGTFAPVKVDDITEHKMHAEWIEISKKTLENIIKAKREGRRIIAVGTTSARTLETIANRFLPFSPSEARQIISKIPPTPFVKGGSKKLRDYSGWTDIFIYPGYKFKAVDAMITNFHLPKSTLLMLVSALAGRKKIWRAYQEAIKRKYRFFSYGDAMLII